jgi:energy-coupling factor transport system ATP-binding protein
MAEHKLERVIHFVDRIVLVQGDGQVQIGTPQEIMSISDINPPIVKVAKHLNLAQLPLSVRELKRVTSKWQFPIKALKSSLIEKTAPSVEVIDLSVQLSNKTALNKVNLQFTAGEIVSVMGRNGAGKSTLLRTIAGGSNQFTGKVRIAGGDASKLTGKDLVTLVGYVPQEPADLFFGSSVKNECEHTDEQNEIEQGSTEKILMALSPSINVDTHPRDLSEGQKLVLALALVLVTKPKILILDEPTRGLDYRAKDQLTQILKEVSANSVTVILATHDVELVAELATRVVVIADGEIISDGQTRDVLTSSPAFAPQVSKAFSSQNWLTVADVIFADIKRVD